MWYHRWLLLVLGYLVLFPVLVILVIVFFISDGKLGVMFLSILATLVTFAGGWSGCIFPRPSGLMKLVMNWFFCMGLPGYGFYQLWYIFNAPVFASPSGIHVIFNFGEKSTVSLTFLPLFRLYIHCGSDNALIWHHYTILDHHWVTNRYNLCILHLKPHRFQIFQLD